MGKSVALALIVCAAAVGLPRMASAGCDKDTDCKGDRICQQGECVSPEPGVTTTGAARALQPGEPTTTTVAAEPDGVSVNRGGGCPAGQPGCTTRTQARLGPSGAGVAASGETVTAVEEPGNGSVGFGADLGMNVTTLKSGGPLVGLGVGMSVPILIGTQFPGADGGSWNGLALFPEVMFAGARGNLEEVQPGEPDNMGLLTIDYGAFVGYQYLHFGPMQADEQRYQSGFGVRLGAFLGGRYSRSSIKMHVPHVVTGTSLMAYDETDVVQTSTDFSWGPSLSLVRPFRNEGTSHVRSWSINVMVMPVADTVSFSLAAGIQL